MKGIRRVLAVAMVGALAGACAPGGGTPAYAPEMGGPERTTVRVENNNWSNMTVYLLRGTTRYRLGMVTSMTSRVFRVPPSLMGGVSDVRLMVDPLGSHQTFTTPNIQVNPGEEIEFNVQNHLAISSVSVWARR